jgi:hypothetical protein
VNEVPKVWHSGERVSEHFIIDEFRCHGECCADRINVGDGIALELLAKLEALRNLVNRPINLTCAYRCPVHNRKVGGVETSTHVLGQAADIYVNDLSVESLAAASYVIDFSGIGQYPNDGFVHVSVGKEGRWIKDDRGYVDFHVDPSLVEYWRNVLNGNNPGDTQNSNDQKQTDSSVSVETVPDTKTSALEELVAPLREKLAEFKKFIQQLIAEIPSAKGLLENIYDQVEKQVEKAIDEMNELAKENWPKAEKLAKEKLAEVENLIKAMTDFVNGLPSRAKKKWDQFTENVTEKAKEKKRISNYYGKGGKNHPK